MRLVGGVLATSIYQCLGIAAANQKSRYSFLCGCIYRDSDTGLWGLLLQLAPELRDNIFDHLAVHEYANYLEHNPRVPLDRMPRATDHLERKMMTREAEEYNMLDFSHEADRPRMREILHGLYVITRAHNVRVLHDLPAEAGKIFESCASLSPSYEWRLACMMALVKEGTSETFGLLSEEFLAVNRQLILEAAAAVGDEQQLDWFRGNPVFARSGCLEYAFLRGVAFGGLIHVFQWLTRNYSIHESFMRMLLHDTIKYGQFELFQHLLSIVSTKITWPLRSQVVADFFHRACGYGELQFVRHLHETFPHHLGYSLLNQCLCLAARSGNISILEHFLGDGDGAARDKPSFLSMVQPTRVLKEAMLDHQGRSLQFVLPRLLKGHRDEIVGEYLEIFAEATSRQNLRAIDLLLGWEDDAGSLLAPEMRLVGRSQQILKDIASEGRVDVLKHLISRYRDADGAINPRFEAFSLSTLDNIALRLACQYGRVEMVRFLLAGGDEAIFAGIDAGALRSECVLLACEEGHLDTLQELLRVDEQGRLVHSTVDPLVSEHRPLLLAAEKGHLAMVAFLLQKAPQSDHPEDYLFEGIEEGIVAALRAAVQRRHLAVVEFLLARDKTGRYCNPGVSIPPGLLEAAASSSLPEIVAELLRHPLPRWEEEITKALDAAIKRQNLSIILLLYSALHRRDPPEVPALLYSLLLEGRVSFQTMLRNLVGFPLLEPWQRDLTRRWVDDVTRVIFRRLLLVFFWFATHILFSF